MAFKLDVTGDKLDQLDNVKLAPDWYLATCVKVYDHEKDAAQCLDFNVKAGPFTGAMIGWKLQNPELCNDEAKARDAIRRLKAIGKRLGVIYEDEAKRTCQRDWQWAVGKEYVIQVELRTWQKEDGGEGSASQVAYMGCYNLDHPEIPPAVRLRLGLPLLPGQSLEAPAKGAKKGATTVGLPGIHAGAAAMPCPSVEDLAMGF